MGRWWFALALMACGREISTTAPTLPLCDDAGPAVLLNGNPGSVAVDDESLYWVETYGSGADVSPSQIEKMPKAGGASTALASSHGGTPLVVDGSNVYWVDGGTSLMTIPKAGGTPILLASGGGPYIDSIVVDGQTIYVSSYNAGTVESIPKSGGSFTRLATEPSAHVIAVDDSNVFWATNDNTYANPTGAIRSAPKQGGTATDVFVASAYFRGTTADATAIYIVTYDPNNLVIALTRIEKATGATTVLRQTTASSAQGLEGFTIVTDSIAVYVREGFRAEAIPVLGGPPQPTLALADVNGLGLLAVDDHDLYFVALGETTTALESVCK